MTIVVELIRRWRFTFLVILGLFFFISLIYFINKYIVFEKINRLLGPFHTKEELERRFSHIYPSEDEIASYLTDATVLISSPSTNSNRVYYFDYHHQFIRWSDNTIEFGSWTLRPVIQIMQFESRWRITGANIYCHWFYHIPAVGQLDNCYIVGSFDQIPLSDENASRDYRKGNIFGLSQGKAPPLPLPTSSITIDTVLRAVRSRP
jgi:hypothetical protein